ncbi:KxYKxGKxW signal peptide domain-containing protein [Lacticaseibacillus porcinae]|uniref:KxYKxGKxW signal peptide domain-containing protein n=1 Tax=Lacticaseibacillus porcinae TaxID=1123687 RepID=UPI000F7932B7|nr:KxYKxGKxW signal peptide domain-containing protein [Lacticaseibacillus porcinae]
MRKNNRRSISTTEVKSRVKMWRSGKNWVYGLLFFFGMASVTLGQAHQVHADTTALDSQTQKGTVAEQLTAQKVVLQSSITPATADSTNTATSDSDTGSTAAAKVSGTITADTPATTDSTGDNNVSATTESPASDPASSTTTEKTDLTGVTETADSLTAAISDAKENTASTASDATTTDETSASAASTTDAAPTSEDTTTTETSTTDASQTTVDDTTSETDTTASNQKVDAPSTVDTTNTPLPEVSYKSMLSAAQVNTLNGSTATSGANDNLPEGFTVDDPDYPDGSFHEPQDSDLYSFFQGSAKTDNLVLSVNRNDVNEIHAQILTADGQSAATDQVITEGKNSIGNWTVINDGGDISSLYIEHTGDNFFINYDVDAYPKGSYEDGKQKTWVGWAALKPMSQTQTTYYIDKDGNSIADPVSMTGLSGQSYTTNSSSELTGYNPTGSDNTTGTMSPFMTDGQIFREELYSGATDIGTLVYTLKDADTGQMTITLKAKSAAFTFMDFSVTKTLNRGDSYQTRGAIGYTVKNIYLPQTTSVTYTYDASLVNVPVVFKDQNDLVFDPGDSVNSTIEMAFKANTPVSAPDITGYTYNRNYTSTVKDNPTDYTVTDFANPGTITWHYTANPEKVTVHHVDGNGKTIASDTTIDGVYAQGLSLNATTDSSYDITNYQPRSDAPTSYTFNDDADQSITITYDQTASVQVHYVVDNANNTTTPLDVSALDLPTTLTGVVDTSVDVPTSNKIPGYTAVPGNPTSYKITQGDTKGVTLHYTANTVNVKVHFEDAQTHEDLKHTIYTTTTTGKSIQVKVAGPDLYVMDGYTFSKNAVTNGKLDQAADGSVLVDVTAPTALTVPADGKTPYIVTVPMDKTQYVDAPTDPTTDPKIQNIYKMTHRTFTVQTSTTAGDQFAATNGNQKITYTRQYVIDQYGDQSTIVGYGNWVCQTEPLADVTSADPDGYNKTITLTSTLISNGTTMADDTALNMSLQEALDALMSLPNNINLANTANATIDISYTVASQKLTVHYQFNGGDKQVDDVVLTGDSGTTVTYGELATPFDGYVFDEKDSTLTSPFDTVNSADQTATLVYNATGDYTYTTPGTDQSTTTQYKTDPDDPFTATGTIPYVEGYTPTSDNGTVTPIDSNDLTKGYTLTPEYPTTAAIITYTAETKSVRVEFVDKDGEIKGHDSQTLSGTANTPIDYTTINKLIDGYVLVTDGTTGHDKFTAADNTTTLTLTYNKTDGGYNVTQPGNDKPTNTPYVTNPEDPSKVNTIEVPSIPGYTPEVTNGTFTKTDKGYTVTPDDPTQPTTVTYKPEDGKSVKVAYVEENNDEIDGHPVTEFSGETDQTIDYGTKVIAGYVLTADGTKDKTTFAATDAGTPLTIHYKKVAITVTTPTGEDTTVNFPSDPTDPTTVQPGHVDYIKGYTPKDGAGTPLDAVDNDKTKGYTVPVPVDPTTPTTITYAPDEQIVNVHLIDTKGAPVENDEGDSVITVKGYTGEGIQTWKIDKFAATYKIVEDQTAQPFTFDDDDDHAQDVYITYLKLTQTTDPDGGTTILSTDGNDVIVAIDRDWPDGDHTHVDFDLTTNVAIITETPDGKPVETPVDVQPGDSTTVGKTTLDNGKPNDNVVLTHAGTDGDTTTETITPDGKNIFTYTQTTHDPDGGTTTTTTDVDDHITTIDRNWPDGDRSHVDIDTGTGVATITETPKDGDPTTPVEVQPGDKDTDGKTTLDNGEPDGNVVLTHPGTDGDTNEAITPEGKRIFTYTQTTHDPDGGTTTTTTDVDGHITTIDRDWPDGDRSHVDIDTGTGVATITETPKGGASTTPVEVQPGKTGNVGKTTLDNGEPDGNVLLTHPGTDGDTTETITPDGTRAFAYTKTRSDGGTSVSPKDFYTTTTTNDPDGGTTATKTNVDGDITAIDRDWPDGDHSHVDIDIDTGVATITETPKGGNPTTPVEVQPGEKVTDGKTTLDNGEPDGNVVLTHPGADGDTNEAITPDGKRNFDFKKTRSDGGISVSPKDFYNTTTTNDPDGGTTTTKTNGDGDILTIDKDWSDGDHSRVDINTDTGVATITETPKGGHPTTPIEAQPGEKGTDGKTMLDNGEPDGNVVLTHQGNDGNTTTETITPDGTRNFTFKKNRSDSGISVSPKAFYNTTTTNDPDGGTTTTKTNGDGDILTIDKDWSDGDHSHVDIDIDTGVATITETPKGEHSTTPIEVQPGEKGADGNTTLDNGEPNGNVVLTHQGNDGDTATETITPDGTRTFAFTKTRIEGDLSVSPKDFFTTTTTNDPDGGTTTTKTNGDGDITTIDKDWPDGDRSHVNINTDTGVATIIETPKGGAPTTPIAVQPGDKGTDGKTTLDNGEPDGNIILTHQGTDGDITAETITPDGARTFAFKKTRSDGGISVDPKDFYDTRTTDDHNGGSTTIRTDGNGDITTINNDWDDGDHTHVDVDPNTGDATVTDTDQNGHTTTPITIKPGDTATTGTTTIKNNEPDGDVVLTHIGTDGGEIATIAPNGEVTRALLPDTNGDDVATEDDAANAIASTALPQTSARTDVPSKKSESLPQTGDKQSPLGLLGAILLGSFALLGKRRRRDDGD